MTVFRPGDRVHLKGHAFVSSATGTVTATECHGDTLVRWDDNQAVTPHDPYVLEPAGEPMSTTDFFAEPGSHHNESIVISKTDLPLVGALLTGTADEAWGRALIALAVHEQLRAKEEAADRETLEAEAWAFYVSARISEDVMAYTSMGEMDPSIKARWINVAKHARTMHGVTK